MKWHKGSRLGVCPGANADHDTAFCSLPYRSDALHRADCKEKLRPGFPAGHFAEGAPIKKYDCPGAPAKHVFRQAGWLPHQYQSPQYSESFPACIQTTPDSVSVPPSPPGRRRIVPWRTNVCIRAQYGPAGARLRPGWFRYRSMDRTAAAPDARG